MVGLSGTARSNGLAIVPSRRAILISMTGGASQLETFDPKPDAPAAVRGTFKSIETSVPGLRFSESLPRLAQRADRLAVIRSLHHDAAPIHETGQQLLQTGRLSMSKATFPHWGSLVTKTVGQRSNVPGNVILPGLTVNTGVSAYRGQQAGILGSTFDPVIDAADCSSDGESLRRLYGDTRFGRLLLRARQLVEQGTRCVTVNLFDSLGEQLTWDCHGDKRCGPATLMDYQDRLCPEFDQAMSGLIDDLASRGLLDETLVIATGEFGRTPYINESMGRDHWPGCWSAVVAGARIQGGSTIGTSDSIAYEPVDRPVASGEITATLLNWCGVDGASQTVDVEEHALPLVPHAPIHELWA